MDAQNEIKSIIKKHEARLWSLSDRLAAEPETALEERRACRAHTEFLKDVGYELEVGAAGMETAYVARVGRGRPAVTLLAEMDALPEVGHGCGHNLGGAASLGAAAGLAHLIRKRECEGSVIVLGSPAEERGVGKTRLIEAGYLEEADAAMMSHCASHWRVAERFFGLRELRVVYLGEAAHAAVNPERGRNALEACLAHFHALGALRQKIPATCRLSGVITDGGRAANVIPERAEAVFHVRGSTPEELEELHRQVVRAAEGAALSVGCEVECRTGRTETLPLKPNPTLEDVYLKRLLELGVPRGEIDPGGYPKGSSDVGNVSQVLPTIHPTFRVKEGVAIHTRDFADATVTDEAHRAMSVAAACLALTAFEVLSDGKLRRRIREEFEKHPRTGPASESKNPRIINRF